MQKEVILKLQLKIYLINITENLNLNNLMFYVELILVKIIMDF